MMNYTINKEIINGCDNMKNLPNIITGFRFLLIPVFVSMYFSGIENSMVYSFIIFILAGVSDVLDGMIARKYSLITKLGIVMDPLADKLMLMTVLICLSISGYIHYWIPIVVGIKEGILIAGGIHLYFHGDMNVIPSDKYGKFATVMFYGAITAIVFGVSEIVSKIIITIAVFVTVVAFVNYFYKYVKQRKSPV